MQNYFWVPAARYSLYGAGIIKSDTEMKVFLVKPQNTHCLTTKEIKIDLFGSNFKNTAHFGKNQQL
jgi:hypothetical protein